MNQHNFLYLQHLTVISKAQCYGFRRVLRKIIKINQFCSNFLPKFSAYSTRLLENKISTQLSFSPNFTLKCNKLKGKSACRSPSALTMPMHFFRILQMLTSFLENMGAGRDVLWGRNIKTGSTISIRPISCAIISIYVLIQ